MSVLSSMRANALYHLLHKTRRTSRKRAHVFSFCLFVPPATNVFLSRFYVMILTIRTYAHIHIDSRESIAHQLHHLIYFHRKRERERRKNERERESTHYSCVVTGVLEGSSLLFAHTRTYIHQHKRRKKKNVLL